MSIIHSHSTKYEFTDEPLGHNAILKYICLPNVLKSITFTKCLFQFLLVIKTEHSSALSSTKLSSLFPQEVSIGLPVLLHPEQLNYI